MLYSYRSFSYAGWWRLVGCLKLQVIFRKKAINYRALLRKMTYDDKASYDSKQSRSEWVLSHMWNGIVICATYVKGAFLWMGQKDSRSTRNTNFWVCLPQSAMVWYRWVRSVHCYVPFQRGYIWSVSCLFCKRDMIFGEPIHLCHPRDDYRIQMHRCATRTNYVIHTHTHARTHIFWSLGQLLVGGEYIVE